MKSVALACSGLGHVRRGNETWARTVAETLHVIGESVHLYGGGPLPDARCPYSHVSNIRRDWFGWRKLLSWPRRYAYEQQTFARGLARCMRREPHDVVHVADPVLAYRLSLVGGQLGFQLAYKDGLLLGPDWCRRFEWVQVLAPYYFDEARAAGVDVGRWFVIPHIVDADRFAPPDDRTEVRRRVLGPEIPGDAMVVLGVGDFAQRSNKRLDWLVSEVASLGSHGGIYLVLAGQANSTDLRRLERLCAPLSGRCTLLPNVPQEHMSELYQAADLLAHAAIREPFGIVLIEAMAVGLPVVGHIFPATQWIIGSGGVSIDMTIRGELARVLIQWQREPNLRRDRGVMARERALSTFGPDRIIPLYREMYAVMRSK